MAAALQPPPDESDHSRRGLKLRFGKQHPTQKSGGSHKSAVFSETLEDVPEQEHLAMVDPTMAFLFFLSSFLLPNLLTVGKASET